ncbi:MAG: secretin N-terminal domain-containing protein [Planctomycetota bacterium]
MLSTIAAALALFLAQDPAGAAAMAARGAAQSLTQEETAASLALAFPVPSEDLALAWPADGTPPSMMELVVAYGRLTGQRALLSEDARSYLLQTRVPIDRPTTVKAAEVQGFIEALLAASNFALSVERPTQPRLIRIHALSGFERSIVRNNARIVPATDLALLRRHPAMLFTTVVDLPHTDVRQLSNSLRTMIVDANTMQLLPAGSSNSMLITGFGPQVADLAEHLYAIDAASKDTPRAVVHELVRVKYAVAVELAPLVEGALSRAESQRNGGAPQQAGVAPRPTAQASVIADPRLNALLISSSPEQLTEAKAVIALLDVQ